MSHIAFIPLEEKHLTLLHHWFQIPHVKRWYARNETYSLEMIQDKYLPRIKDHKKIPNYIVNVDNLAIGYIQMYTLEHALPDGVDDYDHPLFKAYSPNKVAGIDLFIGNTKYLKKGIGTQLLNQFISDKLVGHYDLVGVDPDKTNSIAINFFIKNGFKKFHDNALSDHVILIRKCEAHE